METFLETYQRTLMLIIECRKEYEQSRKNRDVARMKEWYNRLVQTERIYDQLLLG